MSCQGCGASKVVGNRCAYCRRPRSDVMFIVVDGLVLQNPYYGLRRR